MKKFHPFLLSVLTGLLLFAAWPTSPLTFLIFIAFVPLLWLERQGIRRRRFFGWVYCSMLIWNAATTWWIWNSTVPGALGAILANSLLMCLPWLGFHYLGSLRRRNPKQIKEWHVYGSLVVLWLTFEYIHLQNWGLSWPWLTLGNVFATHPGWVQWYEYTGTSGGGLWILIVNILAFHSLLYPKNRRSLITPIAAFLFPVLLSELITPSTATTQPATTNNIVIVQPNIDPYEKISAGSIDAMQTKLIRLSESGIDTNTSLVIWPETALFVDGGIDEEHMKQNLFLNPLWNFLRRHPQINLLTGVESYRAYPSQQNNTAHRIPNTNIYVDDYNAAVILDSNGPIQFYHKTKLVPGVETLPPFLHILDAWFEKFGGTTTGYTGQDDRTPLSTSNHSYAIAPAVCYESIYGEFMSRYDRNGADIVAIITNDGWWGNTQGYKQHENYARLRAIETRRWIVRSANTGVSCIINPAGAIVDSRPWDTAAIIKQGVPTSQRITFYTQCGDCISYLAILATILLFVWIIITIIKRSRG